MLTGPRRLEVVEIDTPAPGAGEVLVRVEANTICGSDLTTFRGYSPRSTLPTVPGHEIAGRVVEVGEGVDPGLKDRLVAVEPNRCCGTCEQCRAGLPNICPDYHVLGESMAYQGGCAEYVVAPAAQTFTLPDSIGAVEAALVQPLAISYEGVVRRGAVSADEAVVVIGAGPIGLGAMLLARLQGAKVMVLDVVDYRLEKARELGADSVQRADAADLDEVVLDWTDGRGAAVSIEAVGSAQAETLEVAQRLTARRGRIVVMGSFKDDLVPFPVNGIKNREQTFIGSMGHPETYGPVIELVADGRLKLARMISHTVGLDGLAGAFEALDRKQDGVVKIAVEP